MGATMSNGHSVMGATHLITIPIRLYCVRISDKRGVGLPPWQRPTTAKRVTHSKAKTALNFLTRRTAHYRDETAKRKNEAVNNGENHG